MRKLAIAAVATLLMAPTAFAQLLEVKPEEVAAFDFISFEENIAIVLAIAELLNIPREVAMAGMVTAEPDPGVLRIERYQIGSKNLIWANLFAVNDRESMVAAASKLQPYIGKDTTTVGILNNRSDRQRRAVQFADIAVNDLSFDRLVQTKWLDRPRARLS